MNKYLTTVVILLLTSCQKDQLLPLNFFQCKVMINDNNEGHTRANQARNLLAQVTHAGIPGMMLTVHDSENGYWSGAAGYADLSSHSPMEACQMTRAGSIAKTFTAVTILLLQEQGLLHLDDPISKYLSPTDLREIQNAQESSVRQLLNHSSGIFNYILSGNFQTASLNDLSKVWQPEELLQYARGADAYFSPGTDFRYSNTNYILLGMIIEKVTGKPFYQAFQEQIFQPIGLTSTQFAATDPVPNGLVRGYVDFYSKSQLINSTYYSGWDYYTADGGLLSNTHDLTVFFVHLLEGKLLTPESLQEMLLWNLPAQQDPENYPTAYGLGIFKIDTEYGVAYIHSGDAIGYYASLVYFPEKRITISWAVNGNYGKLDKITQTKSAMSGIFKALLQ
jgi:D-alanyl-D-alanine carboxypeptidase